MIAEANHLPGRYDARSAFWWHVAVFNAMVEFWDNNGQAAKIIDLAQIFGKAKSSIRSTLQVMVECGFVEKTGSGLGAVYTPVHHPAFVDSKFTARATARYSRNAIVVECKRYLTSHVRLTPCDQCLVVEYGALIQHLFKPQYFEVLYFSEHPEIRALHDGSEWDWTEVRRLAITASEAIPTKPLTVCLTENKMRWVDEAIQRGIAI